MTADHSHAVTQIRKAECNPEPGSGSRFVLGALPDDNLPDASFRGALKTYARGTEQDMPWVLA